METSTEQPFRGGSEGEGTVFRITPAGTLTTIYNFCSLAGCADGYNSTAGLIQGADGYLYGAPARGGDDTICAIDGYTGCGTVFKMTLTGSLTVLHTFEFSDGAYPIGRLALGSDGNFYGTTECGGASSLCSENCGTVSPLTVSPPPLRCSVRAPPSGPQSRPAPPAVQSRWLRRVAP